MFGNTDIILLKACTSNPKKEGEKIVTFAPYIHCTNTLLKFLLNMGKTE